MSNVNDPAFPAECQWSDGRITGGIQTGGTTGMATGLTKREIFAMAAMQGILGGVSNHDAERDHPAVAAIAVEHADLLLAELAKEPKP